MNIDDKKFIITLLKCGYKPKKIERVNENRSVIVWLQKHNPTVGIIDGEHKIQPKTILTVIGLKSAPVIQEALERIKLIMNQIEYVENKGNYKPESLRQYVFEDGVNIFKRLAKEWNEEHNQKLPLYFASIIEEEAKKTREQLSKTEQSL